MLVKKTTLEELDNITRKVVKDESEDFIFVFQVVKLFFFRWASEIHINWDPNESQLCGVSD